MLTFWIIAALLMLLAFWFILPALLNKPGADEDVERREANVLIYKDQSRELEADLKNGLIGQEQYKEEKSELERRLLEDVAAKSVTATANQKGTNAFAYSLLVCFPIGAIALYLIVGNPKGVNPSPSLQAIPANAPDQPGMMSQQQIAANVDKLAERLKQNPNDAQGWN